MLPPFCWYTYDLNSAMTVLVRPYRAKGGTNDVSLDVYPKMRMKVVFSPPHSFFDYKSVALFVLGAALPCLPACIFHKRPMLINSLFACCFPSRCILSVMRQKNLSFSKSWHQVSSFNQKTVGSFESPPHQGLWVQVPIWVLAGFEFHPRSAVSQPHRSEFCQQPKWAGKQSLPKSLQKGIQLYWY